MFVSPQLKYYEALRESQCRGTIPVAECSEVLELESVTGAFSLITAIWKMRL